jgi:hypothetical protein
MTPLIKIIHQTWQTSEVPDADYPHVWQESWKTHHPDWEYRLWTDEDNERLVRDHYPQFLEGYRSLSKGVIKSDIARALLLHKFGGLYADLDYICLKPVGETLRHLYHASRVGAGAACTLLVDASRFGGQERRLSNSLMYSEPNSWILIRLVEDGLRLAMQNPEAEYSSTEEVAGPIRFGWLEWVYGRRSNLGTLPAVTFCPGSPLHDRSDAEAFETWKDLSNLAVEFPDSYAVTSWRGGWWNSRWSQASTRPILRGS